MRLRLVFAVLGTALVSACASKPPEAAKSEVAKDDSLVCEREYRMGSNIPKMVCSPKPTDADRQRTVDDFRNAVRPSASKPPGT